MFVTIWRFVIREGTGEEFERHYGPEGTWAVLFRESQAYVRTDLYRNTANPLQYITVDSWQDAASYEAFRSSHAVEYAALDREMENLTVAEQRIV
jgi:heme-degrading monooxygenase HmoA